MALIGLSPAFAGNVEPPRLTNPRWYSSDPRWSSSVAL